MKKFGTPIAAAPGSACEKVGFAGGRHAVGLADVGGVGLALGLLLLGRRVLAGRLLELLADRLLALLAAGRDRGLGAVGGQRRDAVGGRGGRRGGVGGARARPSCRSGVAAGASARPARAWSRCPCSRARVPGSGCRCRAWVVAAARRRVGGRRRGRTPPAGRRWTRPWFRRGVAGSSTWTVTVWPPSSVTVIVRSCAEAGKTAALKPAVNAPADMSPISSLRRLIRK